MKSETLIRFLQTQSQLKVLHWQTTKYPRHIAFGDLYESLEDNIDKFVEVCMGKYGRVKFDGECGKFDVYNMANLKVVKFVNELVTFLEQDIQSEFESDTDLLNIRDDMMASVNKLKYLLTLE